MEISLSVAELSEYLSCQLNSDFPDTNFVIINTVTNVNHECILGNGIHIGPGAKLAACINVGDN